MKELAESTGRSVPALVTEAVDAYVAEQREFIRAVEEGMKAADEGRVVDHETVSRTSSAAATPDDGPLDRTRRDRFPLC